MRLLWDFLAGSACGLGCSSEAEGDWASCRFRKAVMWLGGLAFLWDGLMGLALSLLAFSESLLDLETGLELVRLLWLACFLA